MHPRVSSRVVHCRLISRFTRGMQLLPSRGHLRNEKVKTSCDRVTKSETATPDHWSTDVDDDGRRSAAEPDRSARLRGHGMEAVKRLSSHTVLMTGW